MSNSIKQFKYINYFIQLNFINAYRCMKIKKDNNKKGFHILIWQLSISINVFQNLNILASFYE